MKMNVNPALLSFLNQRPSQMDWADCITLTLTNGVTYRFTSWDSPVTITNPTPSDFGTFTWIQGPPDFERTVTSTEIGLATAEHQIALTFPPSLQLNGVPIATLLQNGAFNLAQYTLDRAIAAPGDSWLGTLNMFFGEVTDIANGGRTSVSLTVKSMMHRFDTEWPRNTVQPSCLNTVFDTGCGISRASFQVSGVVQAGSTVNKVLCSIGNPTDYFDLGILTFTSGALSGVSYQVRKWVAPTFTFFNPMLAAPAAGDTFTVSPGCDRQQTTCSAKFSNLANFRGMPYVPDPTVAF